MVLIAYLFPILLEAGFFFLTKSFSLFVFEEVADSLYEELNLSSPLTLLHNYSGFFIISLGPFHLYYPYPFVPGDPIYGS